MTQRQPDLAESADLRRARDIGVQEAADIVLAMIEDRGAKPGVKRALTAAYDNIRLIPKLPEDQRKSL